MSGARIGLGEPAQGIEVLQELLGEGGEVFPPAHPVQVGENGLAGAGNDGAPALVHDPYGLEMVEVPEELLAVKVR
jgi:hypothetical protein